MKEETGFELKGKRSRKVQVKAEVSPKRSGADREGPRLAVEVVLGSRRKGFFCRVRPNKPHSEGLLR